jgi:hypothetical protein
VAEASWLRQLLAELHSPLAKSTLVYCDNVSVVYLSTNPVQHQRTKHVEIDLRFVRDGVAIGDVRVLHVPTTSQFADIFTKGLPSSTFSEFRSSLNVAPWLVVAAGALCVSFFLCWPVLYTAAPIVQTAGVLEYMCIYVSVAHMTLCIAHIEAYVTLTIYPPF